MAKGFVRFHVKQGYSNFLQLESPIMNKIMGMGFLIVKAVNHRINDPMVPFEKILEVIKNEGTQFVSSISPIT